MKPGKGRWEITWVLGFLMGCVLCGCSADVDSGSHQDASSSAPDEEEPSLAGPTVPVAPREVQATGGTANAVTGRGILRPFVDTSEDEYATELESDMRLLVLALTVYYFHVGALPEEEGGLRLLVDGPADPEARSRFAGPYLAADMLESLVDPWGNPYFYRPAQAPEESFVLRSLGPDGVESEDDVDCSAFNLQDILRDAVEASERM